jgi:hypothetical protein
LAYLTISGRTIISTNSSISVKRISEQEEEEKEEEGTEEEGGEDGKNIDEMDKDRRRKRRKRERRPSVAISARVTITRNGISVLPTKTGKKTGEEK